MGMTTKGEWKVKKHLLFVTCQNESGDDGLAYAVDLAKTLQEGLTILVVKAKKLGQRFEDIMSAVAFAEENEHETAKELARGSDAAGAYPGMVEQCRTMGIEAGMTTAHGDLVPAISSALKNSRAVDMVILSPSITRDGNVSAKELQRLVRTASRPVVTIARNQLQLA
jgi:hypothetical protein